MILQVRINYKFRVSDLFLRDLELRDCKNDYKKLTSIIADLNVANENYCLILKVIKSPSLTEVNKIAKKLGLLIQRLSKRELQIFELAMKGLNSKQISENLFISVETVRSHRKKIVSKAGVRKIEEIKNWVLKENF